MSDLSISIDVSLRSDGSGSGSGSDSDTSSDGEERRVNEEEVSLKAFEEQFSSAVLSSKPRAHDIAWPQRAPRFVLSSLALGRGKGGAQPEKLNALRRRQAAPTETLSATIELKTMPAGVSRVLVVVSEATRCHRIEDLLDNDPVSSAVLVGTRIAKIACKRPHEEIPLFKKNDHALKPCFSLQDSKQRINCSELIIQAFDAGGLKSLRPVLLGEKTVNLDMLILRSLIQQNFFESPPDSLPLPLVSGSIDLSIGDLLFFLNFRCTGQKFRVLHSFVQPHVTHDSLQLSVKERVIVGKKKSDEPKEERHMPHAQDSGVSFLYLPQDVRALLLSYLDLPDLLSMVRTCKSVHALFKSRELFILSNHAVPKLVSFLSCLAPLKAKVFVGQEGKDVPSTQRFERVVLTGAQSVTVAYKGNFVPVAFRFKSLGGNRESVLPIKSVHASDVRKNSLDWHFDLDRPVVDASWCSAFIGAPLQSCVFTFGFSGPVTLTDFQMRGVTRELFWAVPVWRFVLGAAMYSRNDASVGFWQFVLAKASDCRKLFQGDLTVEHADLTALATVLTSDTASQAWKKLAVVAVYFAMDLAKLHVSTSAASELLGQCSRAKLELAVLGPLVWLLALVSKQLSSDSFNGAFLVFVQSKLALHPDLPIRGAMFDHIFEFIDSTGPHCPYLVSFVSYLCSPSLDKTKKLKRIGTRFAEQTVDLIFALLTSHTSFRLTHFQVAPIFAAADAQELLVIIRKYAAMRQVLVDWMEQADPAFKPSFENVVTSFNNVCHEFSNTELGRCVLRNCCTLSVTGKDYQHQWWFKCETCWPGENKGCCLSCSLTCHSGHRLENQGQGGFYCDCSIDPVLVDSLPRWKNEMMRRGLVLFASAAARPTGPIESWTSAEVIAFLRAKHVAEDLISAFEVNRVTGRELYEKDCLICSFVDADISRDVVIDALMRTQGYSVRK